MARVGVLVDQAAAERYRKYGVNVFETYVEEVLGHAGIPFQRLNGLDEAAVYDPDVLVVALAAENRETADAIWGYADKGGSVIACAAGLNGLAARLGCRELPEVPAGYAQFGLWGKNDVPLRCLKSIPWEPGSGAERYGVERIGMLRAGTPWGDEAGPAILRFRIGKGRLERWAVNVPRTIVAFQQGPGPVFRDGAPAGDGSGEVNDGILKADDRIAMDWELDRARTETGAPYFAYPYADLWRERLIGSLLAQALSLGLTLPFIGYWPDGVEAVAMISHDSDLNIDESAATTLNTLAECGVRSTWCMIEPGYSRHIYEKVKQAGHELAFHYNALDQQGGRWGEAEFDRQFAWLKQAAELDSVKSNKNHYTRFEGWGELFEWCEKQGIEADQTRGPSKRGNIGFLFGTCHPYFPIAWFDRGNRMYDVLEIGFLTQDLALPHLADTSVIAPFLDGVKRVEGVAHFLFHQVHLHERPSVNRAIRTVVDEARKRGFVFWTSAEINDWERARRRIRIEGIEADGSVRIRGELPEAPVAVWIPAPHPDAGVRAERKFGVPCRKAVLNG